MNIIRLSSGNYDGQVAIVTYYPTSGGTITIGSVMLPYDYITDYYSGTYSLYFPVYNVTCELIVTPPPTPTETPTPTTSPTPTETPTQTPTPTPTPTFYCEPIPTRVPFIPSTPTPSATLPCAPTSTPTSTGPTSTPTSSPTQTPTPTETPTQTPTPTETPTPTTSPTPTETPTQTPTPTEIPCLCWTFEGSKTDDTVWTFDDCNSIPQTLNVVINTTQYACTLTTPVRVSGSGIASSKGECIGGVCLDTPTPTPEPTSTPTPEPTLTPTSTGPTPTATDVPVPTPTPTPVCVCYTVTGTSFCTLNWTDCSGVPQSTSLNPSGVVICAVQGSLSVVGFFPACQSQIFGGVSICGSDVDCFPPTETPIPTETPTPTPTSIIGCFSAVTLNEDSYQYTDCCGVLHAGSGGGLLICVDTSYTYFGVEVDTFSPCSEPCPTPTPTIGP